MRYTRTIISGAYNAAQLNNEFQKIQRAIDDTLSRLGDNPNQMEANLDMNSNRILNLPNPVTNGEPITLGFVLGTGGSALPFVQTIQPGARIDVDNADPQNPVVSVNDVGVETIVGGTGVTVDDTDPANPVIDISGFVESVNAGTDISIDNTDPQNPIISLDAAFVESVVAGSGIVVDNTDPLNPIINNNGVRNVIPGTNITVSGLGNLTVALKTPLTAPIKIQEPSINANNFPVYNNNGGIAFSQQTTTAAIRQTDASGTVGNIWINFAQNAGVSLYHNALLKLATQPTGVAVTGTLTADTAVSTVTVNASDLVDAFRITADKVWINGPFQDTPFKVYDTVAGGVAFDIDGLGNVQLFQIDAAGNLDDRWMDFTRNGAVGLRYDNTTRARTTATGFQVLNDLSAVNGAFTGDVTVGNLTVTGTMTGPDVPELLVTQDDGVNIETNTQILNFTGAGVVVTNPTAGKAQITISGFDPGAGGVVTSVNGFNGDVVLDYADFAGAENITLNNTQPEIRLQESDEGLFKTRYIMAGGTARIQYENAGFIFEGFAGVDVPALPKIRTGGGLENILHTGGGQSIAGTTTITSGNLKISSDTQFPLDCDRPSANQIEIIARNNSGSATFGVQANGNLLIAQRDSNNAFEDIWILGTRNGAVDLRYDGQPKIATTSTGIDVTGNITGVSTENRVIEMVGPTGLVADIVVRNDAGGYKLRSDTLGRAHFLHSDSAGSSQDAFLISAPGAETTLYYGGAAKFETTNTGIDVTGSINATGGIDLGGNIVMANTSEIQFEPAGVGSNSRLYRASGDATRFQYFGNAFIFDAGENHPIQFRNQGDGITHQFFTADGSMSNTGAITAGGVITTTVNAEHGIIFDRPGIAAAKLGLRNDLGGVSIEMNATNGDMYLLQTNPTGATEGVYVRGVRDGGVELRYDNSVKLLTSNSGITVTGSVDSTGGLNAGGKVAITNATYNNHLELTRSTETWQITPSTDGSLDFLRPAGTGTAWIDVPNLRTVSGTVECDTLTATTITGFSNTNVIDYIKFGPGVPANDDAHIEWLGASNAGFLRISTSDDNGTEYIEFGDYDTVNRGGAFTQWANFSRNGCNFQSTVNASSLNLDAGAQVLQLFAGPTADHVYMAWFADSQNQSLRSAYFGFPNAGSTTLTLSNEIGNLVDILDPIRCDGVTCDGQASINGLLAQANSSGTCATFQTTTTTSARIFLGNTEGGTAWFTDGGELRLYQCTSGNGLEDIWIRCFKNARVAIFYDGVEKLATSSTGATTAGQHVATTFNATSARKHKNELDWDVDAVALLDKIQPAKYTWKDEFEARVDGVHHGFIADDVDKVLPEVVTRDEEGEISGMRYQDMIALLWKQNQELKRRVEELEAKVA